MKKRAMLRNLLILFAAGLFVVSLISVASLSAGQKKDTLPPQPKWWTGYSTEIPLVPVPTGYPQLPTHARFIGELKGSWYDMGKQYGGRAGDLMLLVFNGWYVEGVSKKMAWPEIIYRVNLYEEPLKWYCPELLEFIEGMADGAASYLEASPAYKDHGMTPYQMVLAINLYFEVNSYAPKLSGFPKVATSKVGEGGPSDETLGCSAIALLPKATATGRLIHANSKDQNFWPQEYQVMFTMEHVGKKGPSGKAHKIFRVTPAGSIWSPTFTSSHFDFSFMS